MMTARALLSSFVGAGALAVFALIVAGPRLVAQDVAREAAIELPKLVVTDSRELPPPESWRYAEIPGFEILTNASDSETQRLMRDFQLFNIAVDVVWRGLQEKRTVPISLIICAEGGKFDDFVPPEEEQVQIARASLFLKDREQAAIVLNYQAKTINLSGFTQGSAPGAVAQPAPVVGDEPGIDGEPAADFEVNHYKQLYREYLRFLMSRVEPNLPVWFEEGLAQLFMSMKVDGISITFAKLDNANSGPSLGDSDTGFNQALSLGALIPWDEFFAVERGSLAASSPLGNKWAKQAQGFVHMGLFGENRRYQKNLITFLGRLQKEPATEKLFTECFKMKYKDMSIELRMYIDAGVYQAFVWSPPKGYLKTPPRLALRDATDAEVGRIKGDALRLAGHADKAHTALIAPYIRGERDPDLLAALGLKELAAGRDDRAKKFLDAAVTGKVERPRAYLELARLRSKAHLAKPGASDGRLNSAQTRDVLAPLLAARQQPPPLREVYELMAATLMNSAEVPARETLAVLFDGVNLFPQRLGLVYQTAVLCMRAQEFKGAAGLVELGSNLSRDEKTRAAFAELKASLPPPPPVVTPPPASPAAAKKK